MRVMPLYYYMDVTEPWDEDIDVAEYTSADFDGRRESLSCYDYRGVYRGVLEQMSEQIDMDPLAIGDWSVRLYIASVADEQDGQADLRNGFDQTRLVPPRGWLMENTDELPTFDVDVRRASDENKQFNPSTASAVLDMAHRCIEEDETVDGLSDLTRAAITFVVDGYELGTESLHERV